MLSNEQFGLKPGMMTSQEEQMNAELAKRAVACKAWRWMEGMAYWFGGIKYRIAYQCPKSETWVAFEQNGEGERQYGITLHLALPDLEDPATLGCLLARLREVYESKYVHAEAYEFDEENSFWSVWASGRSWEADTEVEALVTALEASP